MLSEPKLGDNMDIQNLKKDIANRVLIDMATWHKLVAHAERLEGDKVHLTSAILKITRAVGNLDPQNGIPIGYTALIEANHVAESALASVA